MAADRAPAVEARLDVQRALTRLPEAQRVALVLVDMYDVPVAEAAQVLGVPVGTVKSRCSRGRTALAELLREDEGPGEGPGAERQDGARGGNR
ncbi:sigma factor-like helix-turn-helix DNA-binding protein [Kineococcus gypseus]|uniref:sigma factor-like helix-turn-helix DNA-binding protein n=1 Tax=Kineococcus gypseus TaxID=1637102 RepID=UPI003D7D4A97